jgi:hypothetical protein
MGELERVLCPGSIERWVIISLARGIMREECFRKECQRKRSLDMADEVLTKRRDILVSRAEEEHVDRDLRSGAVDGERLVEWRGRLQKT